ncbi:MAG: UbiH/UbiF/VisC/COQ6 family ubiquinone biosynthesis hydroxylase [Pseudomonadota bacterium]|nr:UbiH/UbiF/VisC/COQ6 family ubiquinone biosynthesis hydroxylase [Pseudomonadota bacterium]
MAENYDVVIVGGGMVGLTLACALGDTALKVAVLEAHPMESSWPEQSIGLRVSAITHASRKVFDSIDAWRGMVERRVTSYGEMHVWDASGDGVIHFDGAEAGAPSLGYIIENRIIQLALMERMQQFANIDMLCPMRWQHWSDDGTQLTLTLEDGRQLNTQLLVGADGVHSQVREQAGIETKGWGYDQDAVLAIVKTEKSHQHTCWQRFLPSGPLAFLPMHNHYSCVVWSTTPEQARELLVDDEALFRTKLADAFDHTLGEVVEVCERGTFPLRLQHTVDYVRQRIALVGDAAHSIHPLAGQGVNLGILDAAALAETLLGAYDARRDIGSLATLRRYERWRKGQNLSMLLSLDGFKRLFGSDVMAVKIARNLGLNATNSLTPLKRLFMDYAMGERGDLPKTAL